MSRDDALLDLPEPDRVEGAPHPRETRHLFGQAHAEADLLAAHASGRMHHAWMLTGPRGLGKATLAWRAARFLLATPDDAGGLFAPAPPASLDIPADDPVARRMLALGEPRLCLIRRGPNDTGKALSAVISVDEVRKLRKFLGLSAADGGHRAVIVDAVDEMNPSAANAILKALEEPPPRVTFFLVCHQPARILPTIRSRCRELRLSPLGAQDMARALAQAGVQAADPAALAELSGGSVGEAIRIAAEDGLALYARLVALLGTLPRMDRPKATALADWVATRGAAEARFDLAVRLLDLALARIARAAATGHPPPEAAPGESALIARLAPGPDHARPWADLAQGLAARALLLDMLLRIDETAGTLALR
jgi:DNA polymerase-3 subunit delta'